MLMVGLVVDPARKRLNSKSYRRTVSAAAIGAAACRLRSERYSWPGLAHPRQCWNIRHGSGRRPAI
jgi:hypothetical protein